MIRIVGDEPFDGENMSSDAGFDNEGEPVLVLEHKPVRKPRTPLMHRKDGDPEMSTMTVSTQQAISAERDYEFTLPVDSDDYESFEAEAYEGPTAVDRVLRKVALYTLAFMAVIFLISLTVNLVMNDPMILIPFGAVMLAGFSYAKMEWHVKNKFRKKRW